MTVDLQISADCWTPENWLTYRGDHRESVGMLMGPGYRTIGQPRAEAYSTVVAARYEPGTTVEPSHADPHGAPLGVACTACGRVHSTAYELRHTDGRRVTKVGRTLLGLVKGDFLSELAGQVALHYPADYPPRTLHSEPEVHLVLTRIRTEGWA